MREGRRSVRYDRELLGGPYLARYLDRCRHEDEGLMAAFGSGRGLRMDVRGW